MQQFACLGRFPLKYCPDKFFFRLRQHEKDETKCQEKKKITVLEVFLQLKEVTLD